MRDNIYDITKPVAPGECGIDDNLDKLESALWWGHEKKEIWSGLIPVYFFYHVNSGKVFASTQPITSKDENDIATFLEEGKPAEESNVLSLPTKRKLWLVKR